MDEQSKQQMNFSAPAMVSVEDTSPLTAPSRVESLLQRLKARYGEGAVSSWDPHCLHYDYLHPDDCGQVEHRNVITLCLAGQSRTQISQRLGLCAATVAKILDHGPNRNYINDKRMSVWVGGANAVFGLAGCLESASKKLVELVDDPDPKVSMKAIDMIAKYTGFGSSALMMSSASDVDTSATTQLKEFGSTALSGPVLDETPVESEEPSLGAAVSGQHE